MCSAKLHHLGLAIVLCWGTYGCSGEPFAGSSSDDFSLSSVPPKSEVLLGTPVPVTYADYKFEADTYPEIIEDRETELWARVWRPATLTSRYPLAIFLHGAHSTCGRIGTVPRIDDDSTYTTTGECPDGYEVVKNHIGYDYIAKDLAAQGFIVVSINANRGIGKADDGPMGDDSLIGARAGLILKHLEKLSAWNRGAEPTPGDLGVSLQNRLDLGRFFLFGHSRGGEGARAAYIRYVESGSIWPARIVDPVTFQGIFEIGPTDGGITFRDMLQQFNPYGVAHAVLLPMCDGDVGNLQGMRPFDRLMHSTFETSPKMKATFTVWGANHNYYNTEWQQLDYEIRVGGLRCAGEGNLPLFSTEPGTIGSASQRQTGHDAVLEFFLNSPGMFDPVNPIPSSLSSITRIDRGYSPSSDARISLRLEDFSKPYGTNMYGEANTAGGLAEAFHTTIEEHDRSLKLGALTWTSASSETYFQTNFAPLGSGFDLRPYTYLDLRLERRSSWITPPAGPTDFTVQLVDDTGALSAPRPISDYVSLTGPIGTTYQTFIFPHEVLQTARIPLASFGFARLNAVRGVRLAFNRTAMGSLFVADVRATRAICAPAPKLDLKIRQVGRAANEIQYRVQVYNRDSAPVRLSDLTVKLWISDPAASMVSQVYFAGNVYDGSGGYLFGASGATATAQALDPSCPHGPNRQADWSISLASTDSRTLPGSGGAWVDTQFTVHRSDWTAFASFNDDFSQTPAYQGGVISDRTWPVVYGDDPYFVLYYKGSPIAVEYLNSTTTDPASGAEPSCLPGCFSTPGGVGTGMARILAAQTARPALVESAPRLTKLPLVPGAKTFAAQVSGLAPASSRTTAPGGVELEITSDTPFPSGDSIPVLFVGNTPISKSRPVNGTASHGLTFILTAEEYAAAGDGAPLVVRSSSAATAVEWSAGALDKSLLR